MRTVFHWNLFLSDLEEKLPLHDKVRSADSARNVKYPAKIFQ